MRVDCLLASTFLLPLSRSRHLAPSSISTSSSAFTLVYLRSASGMSPLLLAFTLATRSPAWHRIAIHGMHYHSQDALQIPATAAYPRCAESTVSRLKIDRSTAGSDPRARRLVYPRETPRPHKRFPREGSSAGSLINRQRREVDPSVFTISSPFPLALNQSSDLPELSATEFVSFS